ncbi:hypothetical protein A3F37_03085 [Candidatus Saccharibacteria bacterium RIFCSPHIGHO2_12_FULL_41_12]|nr:MAG: hypothetical protein A3F37_03085 [Candidatus Saccharibacteria bacterium RIFCSPHIGHO2_12_FULL_41_12]
MIILVVEPDRELAKTTVQWLESEGWQANSAHTSQDGLDHLDKTNYDLIILELVIPSSNGIEFLQEVRSYPEWQNLPCIVYTRANLGELGLPKTVMADLNISKVLHKSKDSLKDLSSEVKGFQK